MGNEAFTNNIRLLREKGYTDRLTEKNEKKNQSQLLYSFQIPLDDSKSYVAH